MTENTNSTNNDEETKAKTFKDRLDDMPVYTMTLSNLQCAYTTLKDKNEYLKSAFNLGESFAGSITSAAKPVVLAATDAALKVAKPVVGEIKDPVASIDGCASEVLAKVQEKLPFVKQTPGEIVESAKSSAKDTANYYYEKVQGLTVTQTAVKQLDNAVALSDLMIELCFPTNGSSPEDMGEIEQEEQDGDKGVLIHAGNVKRKAVRRGTRKLMTYKPVQMSVDMVQYAQSKISETTGMLLHGSNYASTPSTEPNSIPPTSEEVTASGESSTKSEFKSNVLENVTGDRNLLAESWDAVYKTSMFIPKKTLQVTGEVFVSAKEMVFAYTNAHSVKEMPHHIVEVAESYYKNLKEEGVPADFKDKAVAFVYVPAQVVSNYIQSNRIVQWVVPNSIRTDSIQVMENVNELEHTS